MCSKAICVAVAVGVVLASSPDADAKYRGFAQEMFFGRNAGAAGAATGGAGVTSSGDIINTFYNPAGLADAKGLGCCFSLSDRYYLLENAQFTYWGGHVQAGNYGTVGASRYNLDYGPFIWPDEHGGGGGTTSNDATILVFTLAGEPLKDLLVGVNISAFQYNFATGMGRSTAEGAAYWADVGLLKYFSLGRTQASGHWLKLGGSLSNLTYSSIDVPETTEDLPVALRLGAAYEMGWWGLTWKPKLRTVETVFQVEYQDILNYEYRTAVRLGGEVRLVEIIALRLGYYRETVDDYDQDVNRDNIESTTYGFGLHLPLHKITEGKLPLKIGVDFADMKQPEYTKGGDTDSYRTVTFCAGYFF